MKSYNILVIAACFLVLANGAYVKNNRNSIFPTSRLYNNAAKARFDGSEQNVQILRNEQEMKNDGSYRYQYETSNGISGMEQGTGGVAVQGANSWISPEGEEIKISYTADENGYHPVGDHIPKTPDYILRALEYIRTHPYVVKDQQSNARSTFTQRASAKPTLTRQLTPPPFRHQQSNARRINTRNQFQSRTKSSKFFKF